MNRRGLLAALATAPLALVVERETDDRPVVYGLTFDSDWRCDDCGTNHDALVTVAGGIPVAYASREGAERKWKGTFGHPIVAIRTDERVALGVKGCDGPPPTPVCRFQELHVKRARLAEVFGG